MEILVTKIAVIFGLFFSTLLATLIPLLCMKHIKRRQEESEGARRGFWMIWRRMLCCVSRESTQDTKEPSVAVTDNDSIKTRTAHSDLNSKRRSKLILSSLNCFSGGIFLASSFIGLLPEIRENFATCDITWPSLYSSSVSTNVTDVAEEKDRMPMAEIIVCCGLFLILSIEQAAHSCNHTRHRRKKASQEERNQLQESSSLEAEQNVIPDFDEEPASHDHSAIRSLMLVATLSIHSFLEGIAIGLQDSVGSLLAIFVAVLFHKTLMAFSMGTNLVRAKQTTKKILQAAFIFSFMSPTGIAVGLLIKHKGGDANSTVLVNAILQSIATGTFLYITFFEVLVKEFEDHYNRFAKVLFLIIGYGAVLGSFLAQHA